MPTTTAHKRAPRQAYRQAAQKQPTRIRVFANVPDEVLHCLAFQHVWIFDEQLARRRSGREGRWTKGEFVGMSCASCGSERRDLLSWNGHLIARDYARPDDYKVKVDPKKGTRKEQARQEFLARRATSARKAA